MSLSAEDAIAIESLAADAGFAPEPDDGRFHVTLVNFDGPFDLLLSLISRRQLDVTEVALSQVTDEFITYLGAAGEWDLGQATEFLVVATTLLDLKAARLLPAADVDDEEDVALLEARDLLFARLLQYRAYKLAASYLSELERAQAPRHGRSATIDPEFRSLLPEVVLSIRPTRFAALAARALTPRPAPQVPTEHVHAPRVSVGEHMAVLQRAAAQAWGRDFPVSRRGLCRPPWTSWPASSRCSSSTVTAWSAFDQVAALGELRVRWAETSAGPPEMAERHRDLVDEEYG